VLRIKQTNIRPPTFRLGLQTKNPADTLNQSYEAMVRHALIDEFDLRGVPIRIIQETQQTHPDHI
jgi:GTP-binding protein